MNVKGKPCKNKELKRTGVETKEANVFKMHSTHFYLQLYGVGHMVKDHSDSESKETCCRHYIGY